MSVVATQRGARTPLLRAERILLSLPWSTIRSRGRDLDLVRIEVDAPVLDLPALQRWLATRPPSEQTKLPVLRKGLAIVRGRIDNAGWRIDGIDLSLRELHPDRPLNAELRGRYVAAVAAAPQTAIPFDLAMAMTQPRNGAGTAIAALALLVAAQPAAQQPSTAFVGVSVLTMENDAVLADQTVIVSQGKIASVAPSAKAQIPAGAVRVEGKGGRTRVVPAGEPEGSRAGAARRRCA